MRVGIIKAGTGVDVGYDFTRLMEDTPLEITESRGIYYYGYVAGRKDHPRGFMRSDRVQVRVQKQYVSTAGES